jgi:hypothetical protein
MVISSSFANLDQQGAIATRHCNMSPKSVIPTGATRLSLARSLCVPARAVEGPWLALNLAALDETIADH